MHLVGLFKMTVDVLGNPRPIGVHLICNKDIYVNISLITFFHGSFDKRYACFHLSIVLMVV